MTAIADIWNQALGMVGVADEIQDPETESSKEATACRRFWEPTRDQVFRDFPWPRHSTMEDLALVETDPTDQWGYSYRMPAKCARIIRVFTSDSPRLDTNATRVSFELGRDDVGQLIYSDEASAKIKYIYAESDVTRFAPDVVEAMVLLLAAKIAPRFGPEAVKLGDRAMKLYAWRIGQARENALNEEQVDLNTGSDFERARDG